jgi:hypothetical protein
MLLLALMGQPAVTVFDAFEGMNAHRRPDGKRNLPKWEESIQELGCFRVRRVDDADLHTAAWIGPNAGIT